MTAPEGSPASTRFRICSESIPRERMRIGTRGSTLALAQSGLVRRLLPGGERAHEIRVIETSGDRNPMASLRRIGGKGVFTKEIEQEMLDGRIDLAVHSLKDLPTEETPGLR